MAISRAANCSAGQQELAKSEGLAASRRPRADHAGIRIFHAPGIRKQHLPNQGISDVRRFVTCSIAFLAVLAVFTVLATPAFDELPSTAPHSAHSFWIPIAVILTSILLEVVDKLHRMICSSIGGT